jgi:two-component system, cell cycle response regulator
MLASMTQKSEKASTLVVDVAPTSIRRKGVLTVVGGAHAGRLLDLPPTDMISFGRDLSCTYPFEDASLSRTHAMVMCVAGEYVIRDSGSTNGTFVNDQRIGNAVKLSDGDRIQLGLGTILRFTLVAPQEEAALRGVYDASVRDGLTGVFNRKHFEERLAAELQHALHMQAPLSVILVDVDHFKRVNDTYGHLAGDVVLKEVARRLATALRPEHMLARYGGEEFVVICRGLSIDPALALAEHLRQILAQTPIETPQGPIPITASLGVASLSCCAAHPNRETLLGTADGRLYRAKEWGRNRVVGP